MALCLPTHIDSGLQIGDCRPQCWSWNGIQEFVVHAPIAHLHGVTSIILLAPKMTYEVLFSRVLADLNREE